MTAKPIYLGPGYGIRAAALLTAPGLAAAAWIGFRWVAVPWSIHRRHTRLPRARR